MGTMIDLTGKQFGDLYVTGKAESPQPNPSHQSYWYTRCVCGSARVVAGRDLRDGRVTCCEDCLNVDFEDLVGKTFGFITVLFRFKDTRDNKDQWYCVCKKCGEELIVSGASLKNGTIQTCRCDSPFSHSKGEGLSNTIIGNVKIGKRIKYFSGSGNRCRVKYWCVCGECGDNFLASGERLSSGLVEHCGCLTGLHRGIGNTIHGDSKTRLYNIWLGMKARCNNTYGERYKDYGGRGIYVDPSWYDYNVFKKDALEMGYSEDLTIDRINVNGPYSKDNCRWTTYKEQANNTRVNRILVYEGVSHTVSQWYDIFSVFLDVKKYNVYDRIYWGWPEKRLFDPLMSIGGVMHPEDVPVFYNEVLLPIVLEERERLSEEKRYEYNPHSPN